MTKVYQHPHSVSVLLRSNNALCQMNIGPSGDDPENHGRAPRRDPVTD